jgi:tripartite-type tricarboxylate transporter receptor subunit TctC
MTPFNMSQNSKRTLNQQTRRCVQLLLLLSLQWLGLGAVFSQTLTYPDKPIKMIVAFTAGGTSDILAREVANQLTQRWGVSVIIENKAGAAGNLGTEIVGRAPADGYTLLVTSFGPIAINPTLFKNMSVNPQKDLQSVALLAEVPTVLVVPSSMGVSTLAEFLSYAKAHPASSNYGSTGIGTSPHMTGYFFSQKTHLGAIHIPYKGAEATRDLVAGRLQYMFATVPSVMQLIKTDQLKALAVSTKMRSRGLPDVPTLMESGVDIATGSWFALFAPKNTPMPIVQKINSEVVKILEVPQIKARLVAQGAEPVPMSVEEFSAFTKSEFENWAPIVKSSGAKAE